MAVPTLSVSLISDRLTLPILNGDAALEGFSLQLHAATSVDKNSRKMLELQFDVAEMSLATYLRAYLDGAPIVAIPAFTGRRFLHPAIFCSPTSDVRSMEQLDGKRVAVPQYWLTSSVWHRGILKEFFGVPQHRIRWVTTADERLRTLSFPDNVKIERAPDGMGPIDLLSEGLVDCAMMPKLPSVKPDYVSPFPDLAAAQLDYYERSRVFPIMHMTVVSKNALAGHPALARDLMDLFARAKDMAEPSNPIGGLSDERATQLLGDGVWVYGVDPNRRALDAFLGYALEQGLIDRPVRPEQLFADVD
jgi:4,5-dihydroxyphthalate decarboxylase